MIYLKIEQKYHNLENLFNKIKNKVKKNKISFNEMMIRIKNSAMIYKSFLKLIKILLNFDLSIKLIDKEYYNNDDDIALKIEFLDKIILDI